MDTKSNSCIDNCLENVSHLWPAEIGVQLAHLIGELRGPSYAKAAELKKKSELVAELAKLFDDAAEGRLKDGALAGKLNAWLPFNLRDERSPERTEQASAA
jgi:hypothetical protein